MHMSSDMFEGRRAYSFVEKISFPRLFGSEGSKKARMIIKEELKSYGYLDDEIKSHKFMGDRSQVFFLVKVLLCVCLAFIVITYTFFMSHYKTCRIGCFIFIPLIYGINELITRFRRYKEPKTGIPGENIYINLVPKEKRKMTVVFLAHYDTKSQKMNPVTRKLIIRILLFGLAIFPSITFLSTFYQTRITDYVILFLGMFFSICCLLITYGTGMIGNRSSGSVDNGTSVSTMLELCRIFRTNRPKHVELLFLLTDGEEVGMVGSSCFITKYSRKFERKSTYVINMENLGIKDMQLGVEASIGFLKKQFICCDLIEYFTKKASKRCKVNVTPYHENGGSASDHIPFLNADFKAIMFTPIITDEVLKVFHSPLDTMELVDVKKLEEAGIVAQTVVECIDEDLMEEKDNEELVGEDLKED